MQQLTTFQRVLVFGATGGTGRFAVERALEQGLHVSVFSRNPEAFALRHPRLALIRGNVRHAEEVAAAMAGHDAVICCLGMPLLDGSALRTQGTQNIVDGMRAQGVERLICLSVLGLGESWDNLSWVYKYLVYPTLLRRVVKDHRGQEQVIRASGLDWTVVRPPNLADGPATGKIRHGFSGAVGPVGVQVRRADVASFMVDQLTSPLYRRDYVSVTQA